MSEQESWCQPNNSESPSAGDSCQKLSVSSLCEQGWRPLLLTGFLRDLLLRHFAEPLSIEHPDLRRYVWSNDERTGILIESVHHWRGDVVQKRPAVMVKRNPYSQMRIALNDLAGTDARGNESYTVLWVGSHTLFCLHGTGAGVEVLATEVQRELTQFAPEIRRSLGLLKFAVTEIGAISEVEESREHMVVPVTIGWAYQENWILQVEALPIRRIPLSILLDCPSTGGSTLFVDAGYALK